MAGIIRLKRRVSGSPGAPASLKTAELAYNMVDDIIYAGHGDDGSGNATAIKPIGGSGAYVDKTSAQTIGGVKTFSSSPVAPTPTDNDNSTKVATTEYLDRLRGANNGLATLDGTGKIPTSQLPAAITGAMSYQGTWNAATNTPTLTSGTGTQGHMYKVSVAGTTSLDGYNEWDVGDFVVFNGTTWDGIDGDKSEVTSVAGRIGAVVLTIADISGGAPLASPAFTGNPTAPTQTQGDNSTKLATTAYVDTGLATKLNSSAVGTIASQNANSVAITGGSINGVTLGNTVAFSGTDLDGGTF